MANGKINTIIIRDETKGGSSGGKNVTKKDFDKSGKLKPKRDVTGTRKRGRPKGEATADLSKFDRTRPFTTLFNKMTGGMYERGKRGISAAENWNAVGYGPGFNIIAKMVIDAIIKAAETAVNNYVSEANSHNEKETLRFRTGDIKIAGNYKTSTNFWTGKVTYKSNR